MDSPPSQTSAEPLWLGLALGCVTVPVLAGLWLAQAVDGWLRSAEVSWVEPRLPVLDPTWPDRDA